MAMTTSTFGEWVSGRVGGLEETLNEVQRGQGLTEDESVGGGGRQVSFYANKRHSFLLTSGTTHGQACVHFIPQFFGHF